MKLSDCPVGTKVRVWCVGTRRWDDMVGTVINNRGLFISVKYSPYNTQKFVPDVDVMVEGFE